MHPAMLTFGSCHGNLGHSVRVSHRAEERFGDCLPLVRVQRLGVAENESQLWCRESLGERFRGECIYGGWIPDNVPNAVSFDRIKIMLHVSRRQVIGRHVELVQPAVPYPEWRTPLADARHELPTEKCPVICAAQ